MEKENRQLKVKLLAAVGLLFFFAAGINAEDVNVISENDFLTANNGKLKLELKKDDCIRLSNAEASIDISFTGRTGTEKLKAARWTTEKNPSGAVTVEVYTEKPEKVLAVFLVSKGSEYIQVSPGRDADRMVLKMRSQISVLPDMLAEDYIYFPEKVRNRCRVPTDAYCLLNLMNDGNAMAACLWTTDDTKVYLGKDSPENKTIDYNIIECGKLKKLHIGIISAPGIWHVIKEKLEKDKFIKIDWKAPFDAQWLVTMKLNTGLMPLNDNNFDTWIVPEKTKAGISGGLHLKNKDNCTTWKSLHGTFVYPFYLEDNNFFARIPVARNSYFPDYPPLIYAYKYGKDSASDEKSSPKFQPRLPYDKLVEILPYNGIQHLMALKSIEDAYPATCGSTAEVLRYFKDDQAEEKKDTIIKRFDAMNKFVDVKDKRFNDYRNWAFGKINELKSLSEEKTSLKRLAEEMIDYLKLLENNYTEVRELVKTPDESAILAQRYIELIDDKSLAPEKKEEEGERLGREIRTMGGNRDNLIAKMRLTVKSIRFHLAERLTTGLSPEEEDLIVRLRKSCGEILWPKHGHEGK